MLDNTENLPQFADLSHLPKPWQKQIKRWKVRILEQIGHKVEIGENTAVGGQYFPDLQTIVFYEEWSFTQLCHEMVHVMQQAHGRLTEIKFPQALLDNLLAIGYHPEDLEWEAEAYFLQNQLALVLKMLKSLSIK